MIATSDFLTALECTEFVFRPGLRPGPHRGSLQRSSRPSSWFKGQRLCSRLMALWRYINFVLLLLLLLLLLRGPTSKGEESGGRGEREKRGRGREPPSFRKFLDPPLATPTSTQYG